MDRLESQRQTSQVRPTNEKENNNANFTKAELFRRRQEYKLPPAKKVAQIETTDRYEVYESNGRPKTPNAKRTIDVENDRKRDKSKEPASHLLERSGLGQKRKVPKKDMIALTNKMYENLPEIKKKKEEEKKKGDLKKRMEKVKELDQKLRGKNK